MIANVIAPSAKEISLIVVGVLLVVAVVVIIVLAVGRSKSKKKHDGKAADEVKVVDGVRYTESDKIERPSGEINITHKEGDIILSVGRTVKAKTNGEIMPGKYTVLSARDGVETFNIRAGGFVREYRHGDSIVIADGDEVTAVSHTVILR